jgi:hypothetical protein
MPPKKTPKRLCQACRKMRSAGQVVCTHPPGGRRCKTCHVYGREWQVCNECGSAATCTPAPASGSESDESDSDADLAAHTWLCARCHRLASLACGDLPAKRGGRGKKVPAADRELFWQAQLDPTISARVRLWLVPRRRRCPLWLARLLFWLRFGIVAAALEGPPDTALQRRGRNERRMDSDGLALHLRRLSARGRFPPGLAPVLLTGVTPQGLAEIQASLALPISSAGLPAWPAPERDRLRACRVSLSELHRGTPLNREVFVLNPLGQGGNLLVRRCTEALQCAGLAHAPAATTLGAPGLAGDAARRLLLWT